MNLLDFSLKVNNYPIKKAKSELVAIQKLTENEFVDFVESKKKEIVNYHFKNNKFYKTLLKNDNLEWDNLPILEKKDLQIPLKERLSKGFNSKNIFKDKTSGSTGNPFYFAKDKFTHALTWAIIENRFNWHNLSGKKQARFYGLPKRGIQRKKELLKDFFSNRIRFDVFDLTENALNKWVIKFRNKNFVYLNGYTSVLVLFAKYLIKNNLILKEICPTLTACVTTSEMLFESDKKILQKGFGIKVINEYGASELDLIAFEDVKGNWVLNTESIFVEIINDHKSVRIGEVGDIVITSLYNKANPFIRYKIGDRGAIKKINSKTIILEKLEGRREDVIQLPSGKTAPGLTFYYITKSVMEDSGNIKEIKVIQHKIDSFLIEYVADKKLEPTEEIQIKEALENYLEPNLCINFKKLDTLKRTKIGKLKQFTSLLK
ncbi:MAG: phenylacetate--CoA ligase family protein [Polaribacter sp.]